MSLSHFPRVEVVLSIDLTNAFDSTTVFFPSSPWDDVFHWAAVRGSGPLPDVQRSENIWSYRNILLLWEVSAAHQ